MPTAWGREKGNCICLPVPGTGLRGVTHIRYPNPVFRVQENSCWASLGLAGPGLRVLALRPPHVLAVRQMAIVSQHPVSLNVSFEDARLRRLPFSFRFYARVKSLCYDLLQQQWFSNFKTTMQLGMKWKENMETSETLASDPFILLLGSWGLNFPSCPSPHFLSNTSVLPLSNRVWIIFLLQNLKMLQVLLDVFLPQCSPEEYIDSQFHEGFYAGEEVEILLNIYHY